ncbi:MAG: DUF4261 domain-containing protein [Pseudomonadota bacterium]
MHIILIVAVIGIVLLVYFTRRGGGLSIQPTVQPTDLASLTLRSVDEVVASKSQGGADTVTVWSVCLLDADPELDIDRVKNAMYRRWKGMTTLESGEGSSLMERVISFGETSTRTISLELSSVDVGTPLPAQRLPEQPSRVPPACVGCLLVACTADSGVMASVALSQVVFGLVKTCPQVRSVYWQSSERTLSRREYIKLMSVDPKEPFGPVDLWVSAHATNNENGSSTGYTLGMGVLGGTEFEALAAPESAKELEARLRGLVYYVISLVQFIQNEDTVGEDEDERIRVYKRPSETVHKGWVFQMSYENPGRRGWIRD